MKPKDTKLAVKEAGEGLLAASRGDLESWAGCCQQPLGSVWCHFFVPCLLIDFIPVCHWHCSILSPAHCPGCSASCLPGSLTTHALVAASAFYTELSLSVRGISSCEEGHRTCSLVIEREDLSELLESSWAGSQSLPKAKLSVSSCSLGRGKHPREFLPSVQPLLLQQHSRSGCMAKTVIKELAEW